MQYKVRMTGYLHSDKMDHVRDRIASTELEEAISKREDADIFFHYVRLKSVLY
jgi:hypothetical protein